MSMLPITSQQKVLCSKVHKEGGLLEPLTPMYAAMYPLDKDILGEVLETGLPHPRSHWIFA